MTQPHTIRLRGPWQCTARGSTHEVTLPGSWREVVASGQEPVQLQRNFNAPPGLGDEQVELLVESCSVPVRVTLNGTVLSDKWLENFPLRYAVNEQLESFNKLTIEAAGSDNQDALAEIGLVALEITETSRQQ